MMNFLTHDHALMRGLLVGAVVLASATACSRPDRTETGTTNTGTVTADTASGESPGNATTPPAATPAPAPGAETPAPRAETGANRDTATAGYSGMERDTSSAGPVAPRDTARVTTDSAAPTTEQSSAIPSDSAPMEVATPTTQDTSVSASATAVQEDTAAIESAAAPQGETPEAAAIPADSSVAMAGAVVQDSVADSAAGESEMTSDTSTTVASDTSTTLASDTSATLASDTSATAEPTDTTLAAGEAAVAVQENADSAGAVDPAVASSDTTVGVGDSAHVARTGERLDPVVASAEVNDTLTEAEGTPVRPAEDSTEVRETVAAADAQTGDAQADQVGAAAIGGNVNGEDAVALMTRQGAQCIVVDPESAEGVVMDMSETPATLNPCGLGSMVFTRIWTKKE